MSLVADRWPSGYKPGVASQRSKLSRRKQLQWAPNGVIGRTKARRHRRVAVPMVGVQRHERPVVLSLHDRGGHRKGCLHLRGGPIHGPCHPRVLDEGVGVPRQQGQRGRRLIGQPCQREIASTIGQSR